ncbi:ATP-grasp domain-containing protein [Anaeromicropila populeti]|uniref:Biotin carboxylase n=1 Tax=Anaeromicropila populeti TaxID=37658 RepID=A0A1I6HW17_9FIRM|nr:ATP-grasp domain-containing protein [Anaeromicropila populeti]SFR58617.1 Biotin carboxylase [Anaeromicropila populeti]
MKKIMIIGVGWEQLPLVHEAKKLGFRTVAVTTWKKELIPADVVYEAEPRDLDGLELIFQKEKPDGIIADECDYSMYAVAWLTEKYNLAGPGLKALTITNNKYLQRDKMKNSNVPQPEFELCWNYEDLQMAAARIGYPVIVKPVDNRGSIGVVQVLEEKELKTAWYLAVSNAHSRMVLVEKFIEGAVVTAEGFYDSEKFHFISVSTKETYPETKNVAKVLYYPGKLHPEKVNEIEAYVKEIVEHCEICFGFTHFEFILEEQTGNIYFVEAANRGGGVFISNLILKSITGIDFNQALIQMAMGEQVKIKFNKEYISKTMMYFLASQGNTSPEQFLEREGDKVLAMHLNPLDTGTQRGMTDARRRTGVILLSGDSFDEIESKAKLVEKEIAQLAEEFIHINKIYEKGDFV